MNKTNTIAFYIRVSTKLQDTPEGSLKSQQQRLEEWYEFYNNSQVNYADDAKPYSQYQIYKDVETGTKAAKRLGYMRMITDIRMGKISAIASISISRLNRNLREFYELYDISKEYNVDIISLKEHFDTSTAIGRAILKFMLVFYELESEQTSERGKDNRYARAKRGLWVSSTIMGYNKHPEKPGHLIPIPEELEIINTIFDIYISTGSISSVIKLLKEKNIKTPGRKFTGANSGKPRHFKDETVRRILHNKTYVGIQQYLKSNREKKGLPPGEAYEEIEGLWDPIVDKIKFNKAQDILNKNKLMKNNSITSKKKVYELSSMIYCGSCRKNEKLMSTSGTSKTKKVYHYYSCPNCKNKIQATLIENLVIKEICKLSLNKELLDTLIKEYNSNYNNELIDFKQRLEVLLNEEKKINQDIENEIERINKMKNKKMDLFINKIREKHDILNEKLISNIKAQNNLKSKMNFADQSSIEIETLRLIISNLDKIYTKIPAANRKAILSYVISEILLFKNKVKVMVSDQILTLNLKNKSVVTNEEFVTTPVGRGGRDSNSQRPA